MVNQFTGLDPKKKMRFDSYVYLLFVLVLLVILYIPTKLRFFMILMVIVRYLASFQGWAFGIFLF